MLETTAVAVTDLLLKLTQKSFIWRLQWHPVLFLQAWCSVVLAAPSLSAGQCLLFSLQPASAALGWPGWDVDVCHLTSFNPISYESKSQITSYFYHEFIQFSDSICPFLSHYLTLSIKKPLSLFEVHGGLNLHWPLLLPKFYIKYRLHRLFSNLHNLSGVVTTVTEQSVLQWWHVSREHFLEVLEEWSNDINFIYPIVSAPGDGKHK